MDILYLKTIATEANMVLFKTRGKVFEQASAYIHYRLACKISIIIKGSLSLIIRSLEQLYFGRYALILEYYPQMQSILTLYDFTDSLLS